MYILKFQVKHLELAMATNLGGYDCKFVEEPPDDLLCLICTFVAKDPQQVTCCGKIFCRACLVEQKKQNDSCPQCRESATNFEDKKSYRTIKKLKVKCNNDESGCEWGGEISQIDSHLEECQYQLVQCPNECKEEDNVVKVLRKDLADHLKSHCTNPITQCVHCKEEVKYSDITTTHLEKCKKVKIPCTNEGCQMQLPRDQLFNHRRDDCPFEKFPCKYLNIGCTTEVLRKDRESHESNDQLHLHLAIETISKMKQNSFTFKMSSFEFRKTIDEETYVRPIGRYSRYQLYIHVDANGRGEGYRNSISVHLENPNPCRGMITVELLNQLQDDYHWVRRVKYSDDSAEDDKGNKGDRELYMFPSFILHSDLGYAPDLNCQYLKDDCLFFRVTVENWWLSTST